MIVSALRKINAFFLEILFPRACLSCKKSGTYFCMDCAGKMRGEGKFFPGSPGSPGSPPVVACLTLDPNLKRIIHYYKYCFAKELAEPLGLILRHQFEKRFKSDNIVVVPVPLHKNRLKYRSFNQAELLALEIGRSSNILIRTKHTDPQAKLDRAGRLKNLANAFILRSGVDLKGKTVILIDDVCTTGSTLGECAKALKAANPKEIYGLVIARGC